MRKIDSFGKSTFIKRKIFDEMKDSIKGFLYWIVFIILATVMCFALFAKLGSVEINFTDEATHGINAYEMIQNNNFWINTLRYEVDYYNTKPPLMLWLIILGYKIFGYTPLGLRFFSAMSGLVIYLLSFCWIYKVRGKIQSILFSAFLPACTILFKFHMFRSGDMDSVYTLFFLIGMIVLYKSKNDIRYLLLYGVASGLAFMVKSSHFITIITIGLLFIPYILKKNGVKNTVLYYILSYIIGIFVVLPWVVVRYKFDGTAFFSDILFDETLGRVQGNSVASIEKYFSYIVQLVKEPICLIAIILIIIAGCIRIGYAWKNRKQMNKTDANIFRLTNYLPSPYLYLLSIWFLVVLGAYSITKSQLEWYIYPAYIPLMMLGAEALTYIAAIMNNKIKNWGNGLICIFMIVSVCLTANMIYAYPWLGSGGSPRIDLYNTLLAVKEESDEILRKRVMYIENSHNVVFERNRWEHDCMFYAVTTMDAICKDGGVNSFLETDNMDAVLILDKRLWEEYASILTGYVILEDSGYLVFSKNKY